MPKKWKTIRIFISSTFRDMHVERDHLVRFVFPVLKEKCRKHRVHLIDVDLRWGVTDTDAQEGKALDICLDEIDTCRPYFLGLLGHRYGFIPPGETHSITAQEIFHAVLNNDIPKQVMNLRRIIEGKLEGKTLTNEQTKCLLHCYPWNGDKEKWLLKEDVVSDELEIIRAVFKQYSAYQRNRSFFFFRSEELSKKLAGSNVDDFFEKETLNQNKLADLKQKICDLGLPSFEYDEIEILGEKVEKVLWERIVLGIGELTEKEKDWLDEETEFHELFVTDRTRRFVGRRELLSQMHAFCGKDGGPSALLISGEPGCGKSALMGKFTSQVLHNHPDWLILYHFIGASPDSTNLRQTLKRLCTYLNRLYNIDDEVPEDVTELKQIFADRLEKAANQKRILIIFDAVNQFEKADNAREMQWLPQKLPDNVKFVISSLAGETYDALKIRRDKPEQVQVVGLKHKDIKNLVHDYLKEIRKKFPNKDDERSFYDKVKNGNPLYVLVALEELRVFGKFNELKKRIEQIPLNLPGLFDQVLERIEDDFSEPLVRDCMALIACGRQGMTAEELQELLSSYAPRQDATVPVKKLPDMIWARLSRAFSPYLFKRSDVIDFFHGQLKEAVGQRYLKNEAYRNRVHKKIADYFEKRWKESYVRSLEELPHQLTKSSAWAGAERVLCDLGFIEAKCAAGMTYELINDYKECQIYLPEGQERREKGKNIKDRIHKYTTYMALYLEATLPVLMNRNNEDISIMPNPENMKFPEVIESVEPLNTKTIENLTKKIVDNPSRFDQLSVFCNFVISHRHLFKIHSLPSGFCLQQAYNSTSSGPLVNIAEKQIKRLRDGYYFLRIAPHRPLFFSNYALQSILYVDREVNRESIRSVGISPDGSRCISHHSDGILRVWDLDSGRCLSNFRSRGYVDHNLVPLPHNEYVFTVGEFYDHENSIGITFCFFDLVNKEYKGRYLLKSKLPFVSIEEEDNSPLICDEFLNKFLGLPEKTSEDKKAFRTKEIRSLEGHRGKVYLKTITPDFKLCISVSSNIGALGRLNPPEHKVCVWRLQDGECLASFEGHMGLITCASITPDGKYIVSGSADKTLRLWNVETGECGRTLEGHIDEVTCVDVTPDGRRVVSGSKDGTIRFWDAAKGDCIRVFEGHIGEVNCVTIDAVGAIAVTGGNDGTIRVWNLIDGHPQPDELASSSGGSSAISMTTNSKKIFLRDFNRLICRNARTRRTEWEVDLNSDGLSCISVAPNNRFVVTGGGNGKVCIWNINNANCLATFERSTQDRQIGHYGTVDSVRITPDSKRAVTGGTTGCLILWDIERYGFVTFLPSRNNNHYDREWWEHHEYQTSVNFIDISPDGRKSISGGKFTNMRLWDLDTGRGVEKFVREVHRAGEGHASDFHDGRILPDGKAILTWEGNNISVIDFENGKCLKTLTGAGGKLAVTGDGRMFISSCNNVSSLWDIRKGKCVAKIHLFDGVHGVDFSEITPVGCFAIGQLSYFAMYRVVCNSMILPTVTATRLWRHGRQLNNGFWEEHISAGCPWCGKRYAVTPQIVDAILSINREAVLPQGRSPCLELPEEAWNETHLKSKCPNCSKQLKFNPFIVDNSVR